MEDAVAPDLIDRDTLSPIVRQLLSSDTAEVADWEIHPLGYSIVNPATGALFRVVGTTTNGGRTRPWSLVLKGVRDLSGSAHTPFTDPGHPSYWRREALAYWSGLLDDIPGGLVAPRCLGVSEEHGAIWLWIEEFTDAYGGMWPIERYGLAGYHLGGFNGAYLAGRPLPTEPWIHGGILRSKETSLPAELQTVSDAAWEHPAVRRAVPTPLPERLRAFYRNAGVLLSALYRLPHTLCHNDAWRPNLFVLDGGAERTGLIDWAALGLGPVGEEMVQPIFGSLWEMETDVADAGRLEKVALEGYMEGLREAGWLGDASLARFGYAASAMFHWGPDVAAAILQATTDESAAARVERTYGCAVEDYLEQRGAMLRRLLDLADEAGAFPQTRA